MNLDLQLTQLESAQLVRHIGEEEATYMFRHALTQDAAYQSLLKNQRRQIHRHVAQAYQAQYGDVDLDEYAGILAQHYFEAGDDAQTIEFSVRAGDVAARVYANAEAIAHYTRAIEAARRNGSNADDLKELYVKRGRELELASQFAAALANYTEMENLGHERNDRALELGALVAQCQIRCIPNSEFNPSVGDLLAEKALQLARELHDRAAESKILWILINLYRLTDRMPQAQQVGEQSLKIAREMNLREQMAYTLNDLTHVYSFGGDFKHARLLIEEAMPLWRELKNMPMLADSLETASMDNNLVGRFDETIAFSEKAYQISQSIGNLWGQTYSLSNVGLAYWVHGETSRAISTMEETLRLSEISGYPVPKLLTRSDLGVAFASLGAFERGIEHVRGAIEFGDSYYPAMRLIALGALIQIYLWMGDHAQAATMLASFGNSDSNNRFFSIHESLSTMRVASAQADPARALEVSTQVFQELDKLGMRSFIPEALYCQGMAERALGQTDSARTTWLQARGEAQAIGFQWQLWKILGALGELESACGNQSQATQFFGEARKVIDYIADHAPAELRNSFLNLPHVRQVKEHRYVEK